METAIREEIKNARRQFMSRVFSRREFAGFNPDVLANVGDAILNVPSEDVEGLFAAARRLRGAERELPRWS